MTVHLVAICILFAPGPCTDSGLLSAVFAISITVTIYGGPSVFDCHPLDKLLIAHSPSPALVRQSEKTFIHRLLWAQIQVHSVTLSLGGAVRLPHRGVDCVARADFKGTPVCSPGSEQQWLPFHWSDFGGTSSCGLRQ